MMVLVAVTALRCYVENLCILDTIFGQDEQDSEMTEPEVFIL